MNRKNQPQVDQARTAVVSAAEALYEQYKNIPIIKIPENLIPLMSTVIQLKRATMTKK